MDAQQVKKPVYYDDYFVKLIGSVIGTVMREHEGRCAALEIKIARLEAALRQQQQRDSVRQTRPVRNAPVRLNR